MAVYGGAHMVPYPFYPGPPPAYEQSPSPTYFLGFLPMSDGSQQPVFTVPYPHKYYSPSASTDINSLDAAFEGLSIKQPAQEYEAQPTWPKPASLPPHERTTRPKQTAKPGKGFFSTGKGDLGSWRTKSIGNNSAIVSADNSRTDVVRKTVYITDVDQQVTEAQLATFFQKCGRVKDCRVCGDPNSAMRFAFIEFEQEDAAGKALACNGTILGDFPLRILPSKTAIVPVNSQYLPKSVSEREKVVRTIYAANIDKKVDREAVKLFFETLCGPVAKIRLLGDWQHSTRIAFVEFTTTQSATRALSCSGALLGSLPVRVSPSKTPVRDEPLLLNKAQNKEETLLLTDKAQNSS